MPLTLPIPAAWTEYHQPPGAADWENLRTLMRSSHLSGQHTRAKGLAPLLEVVHRVPLDQPGPQGLSALTTLLIGWSALILPDLPSQPDEVPRAHLPLPGDAPWDGTGHVSPCELPAAQALALGAHPFLPPDARRPKAQEVQLMADHQPLFERLGKTPLPWALAMSQGFNRLLDQMLRHPERPDWSVLLPPHEGVVGLLWSMGRLDTLRVLHAHGAPLDALDASGANLWAVPPPGSGEVPTHSKAPTAEAYAAQRAPMYAWLAQSGIAPNRRDHRGLLPLESASVGINPSFASHLREAWTHAMAAVSPQDQKERWFASVFTEQHCWDSATEDRPKTGVAWTQPRLELGSTTWSLLSYAALGAVVRDAGVAGINRVYQRGIGRGRQGPAWEEHDLLIARAASWVRDATSPGFAHWDTLTPEEEAQTAPAQWQAAWKQLAHGVDRALRFYGRSQAFAGQMEPWRRVSLKVAEHAARLPYQALSGWIAWEEERFGHPRAKHPEPGCFLSMQHAKALYAAWQSTERRQEWWDAGLRDDPHAQLVWAALALKGWTARHQEGRLTASEWDQSRRALLEEGHWPLFDARLTPLWTALQTQVAQSSAAQQAAWQPGLAEWSAHQLAHSMAEVLPEGAQAARRPRL